MEKFWENFSQIFMIVFVLACIIGMTVLLCVGAEEAAANQIECTVVSCEKSYVEQNTAMTTMGISNALNGNAIGAAQIAAGAPKQHYDVTIQYEGKETTIDSETKYDVGETITIQNPFNED